MRAKPFFDRIVDVYNGRKYVKVHVHLYKTNFDLSSRGRNLMFKLVWNYIKQNLNVSKIAKQTFIVSWDTVVFTIKREDTAKMIEAVWRILRDPLNIVNITKQTVEKT